MLIGILCILFLILAHELGHFLAAKHFGQKVPVFSLGFGPVLLEKEFSNTCYRLSLLPLGGYVRWMPSKEEEEDTRNILLRFFIPRTYKEKALVRTLLEAKNSSAESEKLSFRQEQIVLFSGPLMNVLIFLCCTWLFTYLSPRYELPEEIKLRPVPEMSMAEIGFTKEHLIVSANGVAINSWVDVYEHFEKKILIGETVVLGTFLGDKYEEFNVVPEKKVNPHSIKHPYVYRAGFYSPSIPVQRTVYETTRDTVIGLTRVVGHLLRAVIGKKKEIEILPKYLENGLEDDDGVRTLSLFSDFNKYLSIGVNMLVLQIGTFSLSLALLNLLPFPGLDGGVMTVNFLHHYFPGFFTFERSRKILLAGLSLIFIWCLYILGTDLAFLSASIY